MVVSRGVTFRPGGGKEGGGYIWAVRGPLPADIFDGHFAFGRGDPMKSEIISMIAATVSALAAIATVYLYRTQGKGFVWTKEPSVQIGVLPGRGMQVIVQIPLFNLGLGNLRFLSFRAKRIHLKNNAIENFQSDMDEAYFPAGVAILAYKTPVLSDFDQADATQRGQAVQILDSKSFAEVNTAELQASVNKKINEIGEVLFVLECKYKDGSWLGFGSRTTTIAMSLKNLDLTYLSVARRRELNELFR
jgi:hypothetical protein